MRWFSLDHPSFEAAPRWMKTFGISKEEGDVYLPAATAGPEELVLLNASASGVASATRHDHAFVPAQWLISEYPSVQEVCRKLLMMIEQVRPTDTQCVLRYLQLSAMPGELDDIAVAMTLDDEGFSRRQITDATWFIPIALGRRVLEKKGVRFSTSYEVFSPEGSSIRRGVFSESAMYRAAYELRSQELSETVVKKLASRSPELHGYRQAVQNGSQPEELETVPIIFFTDRPTEAGLRRAHEHAQRAVHGRAT